MEWTIKQVSKMMGISTDTLRFYEKQGLISPSRSANGYRHYNENDITNLKQIIVMKYAHFTITEIKNVEELFASNPSIACNELSKTILMAKTSQLRQAISNYEKIIKLMDELLPMMDDMETYHKNKAQIGQFLSQIFDDIKKETMSTT